MKHKAFLSNLFTTFLGFLLLLTQAQTSSKLDIYVRYHRVPPDSPTGDPENPFSDLSDAFNHLLKNNQTASEFIFWIASERAEPYQIKNFAFEYSESLPRNLTLKQWQVPVSYPLAIELTNSVLSFSNIDHLRLVGLKLISQDSKLSLRNSSLELLDTEIDLISGSQRPLIELTNTSKVLIDGMKITWDVASELLRYKYEELSPANLPEVHLNRIQVTNKNEKKTVSCLFNFDMETHQPQGILSIQELKFIAEYTNIHYGNRSLLNINGFDQVTLQGVMIKGHSFEHPHTSLIRVNKVNKLGFNTFGFEDNNLLLQSQTTLVTLNHVKEVTLNGLSFFYNTIKVQSNSGPFHFMSLFNIQKLSFISNYFTFNTLEGNINLFKFNESQLFQSPYMNKTSLHFNDLRFEDNKNSNVTGQFNFFHLQDSILSGLEIKKVQYLRNHLSGKLFSIQSHLLPQPELLTEGPILLPLEDINIENNDYVGGLTFLDFAPVETPAMYECLRIVEPYSFNINTLIITNNNFYKGPKPARESNLLHIKQAQVFFNNLQITKSKFYSSNFLTFDQKPSSVVLYSSKIIENHFESSQLIQDKNFIPAQSCGSDDDVFSVLQYRLGFIIDTTFSQLTLKSSTLISLHNGFFAIEDSHFTDISLLAQSSLFQNNFPTPISTAWINRDSEVESFIFKNLAPAQRLWNSLKQEETVLGSDIYFSSFRNNIFQTIYFTANLISLKGYDFEQNAILFYKNEFTNIRPNNVTIISILSVENFGSASIRSNKFIEVHGEINIFSFPHIHNSQAFELSKSFLQASTISSFLLYIGKSTDYIKFSGNEFFTSTFTKTCVTIDLKSTTRSWLFEDSTFSNIDVSVDAHDNLSDFFAMFSLSVADPYQSKVQISDFRLTEVNTKSSHGHFDTTPTHLFYFQGLSIVNINKLNISESELKSPGSLISMKKLGHLSLHNSQIEKIIANTDSALIHLAVEHTSIFKTTFRTITNKAGFGVFNFVTRISHPSVIIDQSTFEEISPYFLGGVFTFESILGFSDGERGYPSNLDLRITNSNIKNVNFGVIIHMAVVNCAKCLIQDTVLDVSDNLPGGSIIKLFKDVTGVFEMDNTTFKISKVFTQPLVRVENSMVNIVFNKMKYDAETQAPMQLIALDSGGLTIQDSIFKNIELIKRSFISILQIAQTTENYAQPYVPKVSLKNTLFSGFHYNGKRDLWDDEGMKSLLQHGMIDHQPTSVFLLQNIAYKFSLADNFFTPAILMSFLPGTVVIDGCTFENSTNHPNLLFGGNLDWKTTYQSKISIKNSTFKNSKYLFGPALNILPFSHYPSLKIEKSAFENNFAYLGGALSIYNVNSDISDTIFKKNYATLMGAAILLGGSAPLHNKQADNTFEGNKAWYEGDVRSDATRVKIEYIGQEGHIIQPHYEHNGRGDWNISLTNVTNTEISKGIFRMHFLDLNGKPTPTFSGNEATTVSAQILSNHRWGIADSYPCDIRQTDLLSLNISLKFIVAAGNEMDHSLMILRFKSSHMDFHKDIPINFTKCRPGSYNSTNTCLACIGPTVALDPNRPCESCPDNAHCPLQAMVCPNRGYWNANSTSKHVLECRKDEIQRCVNSDTCQSCAPGYTGPLCEACDFANNYVENGYLKCGICSDPNTSLQLSILFGTLYVLYQAFSIYALYHTNKSTFERQSDYLVQRRIERSYYIKSLLTYTQLMGIIYLGNSSFYKLIGLTTQVGNPSTLILYGTQCSLKALGVAPQDFLYYQTYFILLSPIFQLVAIMIILMIVNCFIESKVPVSNVVISAMLYFIVSYQPGIAANLTQFLTCTTVEGLGENYISSHPSWSCSTDRYGFVETNIAIPGFVLWCFLFPVIIFIVLLFKKNKRHTKDFATSFGMLFFDLSKEHYYWGVALMIVKLILSFLIFGLERTNEARICVSLVILWGYQGLVKILAPYKTKAFNKFEVILMNLLMLNIIVTKYLLSPENGTLISNGSLIFALILNGSFLIFGGWKILSLSVLNFVATFEKNVMGRRLSHRKHLLMDDSRISSQMVI